MLNAKTRIKSVFDWNINNGDTQLFTDIPTNPPIFYLAKIIENCVLISQKLDITFNTIVYSIKPNSVKNYLHKSHDGCVNLYLKSMHLAYIFDHSLTSCSELLLWPQLSTDVRQLNNQNMYHPDLVWSLAVLILN